jgi:hypothetical protein
LNDKLPGPELGGSFGSISNFVIIALKKIEFEEMSISKFKGLPLTLPSLPRGG